MIYKAVSKNDKTFSIEVKQMTFEDTKYWHEMEQPLIKAHESLRADRTWNWKTNFGIYMGQADYLGQEPRAYVLWHGETRLAMMMFALKYKCVYDNSYESSTFLWWMTSGLSDECLEFQKQFKDIRKIGQFMLDVMVKESESNGDNGRFWLHAAPEGKEWLFEYYREKVQMTVCEKDKTKIPIGRAIVGKNDGRNFALAKHVAEKRISVAKAAYEFV